MVNSTKRHKSRNSRRRKSSKRYRGGLLSDPLFSKKISESCKLCYNLQCKFTETPVFCSKCTNINKEKYCDTRTKDFKPEYKETDEYRQHEPLMKKDIKSLNSMEVAIGVFESSVRELFVQAFFQNRGTIENFIMEINTNPKGYSGLMKEYLRVYADNYREMLYKIIDLALNKSKYITINDRVEHDITKPEDIGIVINNMNGTIGYYIQFLTTSEKYSDKVLLDRIKTELIGGNCKN